MAHEEKNGITYTYDTQGIKPGKRQRVKRVCARWWWLFLLIFICIVLVVVLPIVYVGYPKIARSAASESTIEVTSMSIQNPAPDSIELSFKQKLYTNSSYHPTLYPFNASLYLLDHTNNPPFISIETSEFQASNGVEVDIPPQRANITHLDEFTRYVLMSVAGDDFTIALRGSGDLKVGALPKTSVNYDNNITMKGFGRLDGFSLLSFHVLNETQADGTNAMGTASIPNPTIMTIDLGRVTLSMSVNGTAIGTATIESLVLKPGDNTVQMRAEVYQLVVVGIVLQQQNVVLPIDIKGNQSTFNGQVIPYYTSMLQATELQVQLNVTQAIQGSGLGQKRSLDLLQR